MTRAKGAHPRLPGRAEADPGRVVVLGRGKLGRVLAARLRRAGVPTSLLPGRGSPGEARALRSARVVWLAVPDPAIADVEARVASLLDRARPLVVAHASGATPPSVLARCRDQGASIAAAHPLVSFGTPMTELEGATFVIDGAPRAVRALAALVRKLGARPIRAAAHGPRYHAAAALVANGAAALAAIGVSLLVREGLARPAASRAVGALLRSVADNVVRVGPLAALTGPIARGDASAVERHLASLSGESREAYVAVSRLVLEVAEQRGLERARADALRRLLEA